MRRGVNDLGGILGRRFDLGVSASGLAPRSYCPKAIKSRTTTVVKISKKESLLIEVNGTYPRNTFGAFARFQGISSGLVIIACLGF